MGYPLKSPSLEELVLSEITSLIGRHALLMARVVCLYQGITFVLWWIRAAGGDLWWSRVSSAGVR